LYHVKAHRITPRIVDYGVLLPASTTPPTSFRVKHDLKRPLASRGTGPQGQHLRREEDAVARPASGDKPGGALQTQSLPLGFIIQPKSDVVVLLRRVVLGIEIAV